MLNPSLPALHSLPLARFDHPAVLKQLALASRALAELKGAAAAMPNQSMLISTLSLQEAKDSSEIENIVTTHDELYREDSHLTTVGNAAAKEVWRYRQALQTGYTQVRDSGLLTLNTILAMHSELQCSQAGWRTLPGTVLRGEGGRVVYEPPQSAQDVARLMGDLERYLHDDPPVALDPLIKMALLHHQFESIHPFYDGNGRTGRLINVLYLVKEGLLDSPVLYLSRHIVRTKADYYRLLQAVRTQDAWEDWVIYMLQAVTRTAADTVQTIGAIRALLQHVKHGIRAQHKFYSQDLINNLFSHPYTKVEFIQNDLGVSRLTATKYLNALVETGFLSKQKVGTVNYYINTPLFTILSGVEKA